MPFRSRAADHLDNMWFGAPIYFPQQSTGIEADIVTGDILYAIPDIGLDNICYGGRADCIAVGELGMGQSAPLFFIQIKQYLTALQNGFTCLFIMDCFLERSSVVTEFNNVGFKAC